MELWSLFEGLSYARRSGFSGVEVHVDSLIVVLVLTIGLCGRTLAMKIRHFIEMDWEVVVQHFYREVYQCAGALANFGCLLDSNLRC